MPLFRVEVYRLVRAAIRQNAMITVSASDAVAAQYAVAKLMQDSSEFKRYRGKWIDSPISRTARTEEEIKAPAVCMVYEGTNKNLSPHMLDKIYIAPKED